MAAKYILKDADTGWYLGKLMFRVMTEDGLNRAMSPRSEATTFEGKAKAQQAAAKLKEDTKRAYIVERV